METQQRIEDKSATIAVIGLGYVGLPLACAFVQKGFAVLACDIDADKIEMLEAGRSYINHIPGSGIAALSSSEKFKATTDFSLLTTADVIIVCVPTPLASDNTPDMSFVTNTMRSIQSHLKPGQLIVLVSTTYPGATRDVVKPILEESGLKSGQGFFLAYSPEREDPGNAQFDVGNTPRVVGADDESAQRLVATLFKAIVSKVVPVAGTATAEAVKLTENVFRAVNIALVNELKVIYEDMGIDVWDVIDAATTKPFGYMPFSPGPGLGGHCIPIDPFYLAWRARERGTDAKFIELAGLINTAMPQRVIDRLAVTLKERFDLDLQGSKILLLGLAYKKNVGDTRESPALRMMVLLEEQGATVDYHDPFVPSIPKTRDYSALTGRSSVNIGQQTLESYAAVIVVTDHDDIDYASIASSAKLVVDTRNALRAVANRANIVKA